MLHEFIFSPMEGRPVPKNSVIHFPDPFSFFGGRRPPTEPKCVMVPSSQEGKLGHFRANRNHFEVTLETLAPGDIVQARSKCITIEYGKQYEVFFQTLQLHKIPGGRMSVQSQRETAQITIHTGFSQAAMSELLNRWLCACHLGQAITSEFTIVPASWLSPEPFEGYAPDQLRDGITFERLERQELG